MTEEIQFLEYQKPLLESGRYTIQVEQKINPGNGDKTFTAQALELAVEGERFTLNPEAIHALFPPLGSLGRYDDVLPHISIKRSTFPWERSAYGNEDYEPWLAVLVFSEDEIKAGDLSQQTIQLSEWTTKTVAGKAAVPKCPALTLGVGQKGTDKISVIDVKESLLKKLLPSGQELKLLSHVRKRTDGAKLIRELAVVVGNRLPKQGADNTAYLVSLEGRYKDDKTFNYQSATSTDYIRLVSLKHWSFGCLPDDGKVFEELVQDISTGTLRPPLQSPQLMGLALDMKLDRLEKSFNPDRVLDSSPSNNHGKANGTTLVPDDTFGSCLSFNGTSDYISFATPHSLPTADVPYTIAAWIKPDEMAIGGIIGWGDYATDNAANALKLSATGLKHSWQNNDLDATDTLSGQWHHVVANFDGKTRKIYIDGTVSSTSDTPTGHKVSDANNLTIGRTGTNEYFKGRMAHVQIYARALTAAEVGQLAAITGPYQYLSRGYVAVPHQLRQCDKTFSWYHGPLAPDAVSKQFSTDADLPEFSDALVRYHKDIGMFDSSYASAYEIGRALALKDKVFSGALYQWKQTHNEAVALQLESAEVNKLVASSNSSSNQASLEETLKAWFLQLATLNDVPFNYLVPDEAMLPPDSIRFFKLDQHWIECLLYGAFSIGGDIRTASGVAQYSSILAQFHRLIDNVTSQARSGFMVRSELVLDYPDLLVDGYSEKITGNVVLTDAQIATKLSNIRNELLGPDILMCLYNGEVKTAELYLKPEGLNFGLDPNGDLFSKTITGTNTTVTSDADRVATINNPNSVNSGKLAMNLYEGSNKGRFVLE